LTNNCSQFFALFFFLLTLVELCYLSFLLPLDDVVYDWIEVHRSCAATYLFLSEWPLTSLIALGVFTLVWLCRQQRWTEGVYGGAVIIVGSLLGELFKTAFERARPTALPPLLNGNSFPSGHVIGAVLLAGVLGSLLFQQRTAVWKKRVAMTTLLIWVIIVMWQRLYLMHHWLSDIVGSTLLASAWLCFALARPGNQSLIRHFAPFCVGFLLGYPIFYYFPSTRILLPSVVMSIREPLLAFSFGDANSVGAFRGAWGEPIHDSTEPRAWMLYGEASLEIQLPHRQAYTVQFAARPPVVPRSARCFPLEISINQQFVQRFHLQGGWRRYEFSLDPSLLHVGLNTLTFRTEKRPILPLTSPREAVAFQSLALLAEGH